MAKQTLLSGTSGSSSMGMINDNFTELYDDKIEADSTDVLTNKTIDGDTNTVQDLPYSAIKSTSRTGLDTKVVTGTAGTTDNLAKWNADGDLVDSTFEVVTSIDTSSTDTELPTAKAVYDEIQANLTTKEIFVRQNYTTGTAGELNGFPIVSLNSGQVASFVFQVPDNFTSFEDLYVVMIPDTTESVQYDLNGYVASSGDTHSTSTSTDSNASASVTTNLMQFVNIGTNPNIAALFLTLTGGDIVSVKYSSDTTLVRLVGIRFRYD